MDLLQIALDPARRTRKRTPQNSLCEKKKTKGTNTTEQPSSSRVS